MSGTPKDVLLTALSVVIPLAAFATGLSAASSNPLWLARHPRLLVRSLLVILIVLPIGAIAFLQLVGADPVLKAGLTIAVISIGLGPPAALMRARTAKDVIAYEVGLDLILLVLAIVYIPAVVAIHGAIFHHSVRLEPGQVARVVLIKAVVPMLIGVLGGRLLPRVAAPLARYAGLFSLIVILAIVVLALTKVWRPLIALGGKAWLICAAIVMGEILVGHLVGNEDPPTRRTLVSFSVMRFPMLALLLVHTVPRGKEFIPAILAYVLTSLVLVSVYGAVTSQRKPRSTPSVPVPPHGAAAAGHA